jgi:hypothetical protein
LTIHLAQHAPLAPPVTDVKRCRNATHTYIRTDDLGGHVWHGPSNAAGLLSGVLSRSKVTQLRDIVLVDDNVLGLDITVDNVVQVQVVQRVDLQSVRVDPEIRTNAQCFQNSGEFDRRLTYLRRASRINRRCWHTTGREQFPCSRH